MPRVFTAAGLAGALLAIGLSTAVADPAGFRADPDGTLSDPAVGLMWKRCAEGQRWEAGRCLGPALPHRSDQADGAAATSRFAGHADWRLPRLDELRRLRPLAAELVPELPPTTFWSATRVAHGSDGGFIVDFDPQAGSFAVAGPDEGHAVRLVRDLP
jgi:hypothetical protein